MKKIISVLLTLIILVSIVSLLSIVSCASNSGIGGLGGMSQLSITKGNKTIFGSLFMPSEKKEKYPLVIMSHGYNGCYTDFFDDARYFSDNGYVCYTYDFSGGSTRSRSSGQTVDMTIFTEKQDLLDIVEYFQEQDYIDVNQISLWGGSQGGFVSSLVAAELKDKIKNLIMLYPALCIPDNWQVNFPKEEDIPESYNFWGMTLGKNFFMTIRNFDPYKVIGDYKGNVIIFHGTNDMIVPLSYSERAAKIYDNCKLNIIEAEGHGFTPAAAYKVRVEALEFVSAQP